MIQRHHFAERTRKTPANRVREFERGLCCAAYGAGLLFAVPACGTSSAGFDSAAGAPALMAGTAGAGATSIAGSTNAGAATGIGGVGGTGTAGTSAAGASIGGAGVGGVASAGAGGGMLVNEGDSVLERNHHPSRDGLFIQPKLTKAVIPKLTADTTFAANFDGDMWASPVYITNGPGGKGAFFVVTAGNDVVALDETTGAQLWRYNLGPAPTQNGVNCGNIHPLGILSTPVIDPVTRTLYVAGAVGTDSIAKHEVQALNIDTGMPVAGWPVDVTGMKSGGTTFTPPPQNQRSALSLVGGSVYVAYGGHAGDCGNYHGWVIGIKTSDPTNRRAWATLGQGEAIWAPGGMASDGTSIFAVTGNSTVGAGSRANSDGESVVRLDGSGTLTRSAQNEYYPTTWRQMDGEDADFGANNPIYLTIPGATPLNYIAAVAKDGQFYLLNAANLGGMGGQVLTLAVASGAMSVKTSPTAYTTAKGVHVVLDTEGNAACPGGPATGRSMISVLLSAGSPPSAKVEWCSPTAGEASPISTTTDGIANAAVWYINNDRLMAVDGDTGATLYTSPNACSGVRKWTSPIAVKGRIIAGGDGHLCSWSAH